jgi:hypothetical protein
MTRLLAGQQQNLEALKLIIQKDFQSVLRRQIECRSSRAAKQLTKVPRISRDKQR